MNYIINAAVSPPAVPPITEPNKVIYLTAALTMPNWSPSWQYTFDGAGTGAITSVPIGWLCKNYPDLVKNTVLTYTDDQLGKMLVGMLGKAFGAFGVTVQTISYPATLTDLSSVGTKIANMNPGIVMPLCAGAQQAGQVYDAARQAGYKGQYFMSTAWSMPLLTSSLSSQSLEGIILSATPTDFTPPLNQTAADFQNLWIAKYGSWTGPSLTSLPDYYCLRAALQKAGSIDVDKVAAVLSSGMTYDTPFGAAQMVS